MRFKQDATKSPRSLEPRDGELVAYPIGFCPLKTKKGLGCAVVLRKSVLYKDWYYQKRQLIQGGFFIALIQFPRSSKD